MAYTSASWLILTTVPFPQFNEAFTGLFVVEMVIKLGVLGPHTYFTDGYNVFDFAITWLGLVEIAIQVGFPLEDIMSGETIPYVLYVQLQDD